MAKQYVTLTFAVEGDARVPTSAGGMTNFLEDAVRGNLDGVRISEWSVSVKDEDEDAYRCAYCGAKCYDDGDGHNEATCSECGFTTGIDEAQPFEDNEEAAAARLAEAKEAKETLEALKVNLKDCGIDLDKITGR